MAEVRVNYVGGKASSVGNLETIFLVKSLNQF